MPKDPLLEECVQVSTALSDMEDEVTSLKARRNELAQRLYERDGPGVVYDMGDGRPMILSKSRSGGYFFTPKDKWKRREEKRKKKHTTPTRRGKVEPAKKPVRVKAPSIDPPSNPRGEGAGGVGEDPLEKALRDLKV